MEMTDEKCIQELEEIKKMFLYETNGAYPVCLQYAIDRLKGLNEYAEIKVIGETKDI